MKVTLLLLLLIIFMCPPVQAAGIDLRCEELAEQMIKRLVDEGLLDISDAGRQRAQAISLELCAGAQDSAEQQHEEGKRTAIANWLFESAGGKPGNKRLRRLKR
ncbi:hypothetical protein MNBD_GAMMA26-1215 [hydrothermal vent metagenome]|uniref:Uncharacterized protein n=1 Tax=hydrothermal vent metagenome TaxID=652676 RepID=A0A3B1AUT0_9ZZZZ